MFFLNLIVFTIFLFRVYIIFNVLSTIKSIYNLLVLNKLKALQFRLIENNCNFLVSNKHKTLYFG